MSGKKMFAALLAGAMLWCSCHSRYAARLSEHKQPDRFVVTKIPGAMKDMTKARIERPALILLRSAPDTAGTVKKNGRAEPITVNLLETDLRFNEAVRRQHWASRLKTVTHSTSGHMR